MNRRQAIISAGKYVAGAHLSSIGGTIADFFYDAPRQPVNAIRGLIFGHGTAIRLLVDRKKCGWPYLHALCHATAVASMDAPDAERIAWSRWGGRKDELIQQYWAQHYRREVHPRFVEWVRDTGRTGDYTHIMQFCWGTPEQKLRSEKRVKLLRGRSAVRGLESLDRLVHASRDACESAWQASDETDNEIGRQVGLRCPREFLRDEEARLAWCQLQVQLSGIFPKTPEGPDTARPWGPFHPLHPGKSWKWCPEIEEPFPLVEP